MDNGLFRKKSIERISSPEALHDYMRVTSPRLWMILAAVVLLLGGFIAYASTAKMENTMPIKVTVETYHMTEEETQGEARDVTIVYSSLPEDQMEQIKKGMKAVVSYGTLASQMAGFKYNVWAKTGTAEDYTYSYPTDYPNHMVIGYAGKTNPEIVCTVIVERQKANNSAPGVFKYALTQYFEKYGYGGQKPAKKATTATTTKQAT